MTNRQHTPPPPPGFIPGSGLGDVRADPVICREVEERVEELVSTLRISLRKSPVLAEYRLQLARLGAMRGDLLEGDCNEKMVAVFLHNRRRSLSEYYKLKTLQPLLDYVKELNILRFGDPIGPSFKWLERKYFGDHAAIIDVVTRMTPDFDDIDEQGLRTWLREKLFAVRQAKAGGGSGKGLATRHVRRSTSGRLDTVRQLKLLEKQKKLPRKVRYGGALYPES